MKKQRKILYIVSTVLLVLVIVQSILQTQEKNPLSGISFSVAGQSVSLWEGEDGVNYVFLPSFAELSEVQICLDTDTEIQIDGVKVENGMNCASFTLNTPYDVFCTSWGVEYCKKITFLRSGNVATMFIRTQSGSMKYIHEKKENEERGTVTLYTADGYLNFSGDMGSINGRGNNTWEAFDKKPYSIKLDQAADLLGKGSAQKWILLANADDSSNLRNKIVYDFADEVGLCYSPETEWVDLYLNGEYAGLYLLSERNEIHPERVAVSETESFLVSLERYDRLIAQNYPYVSTRNQQYLRVHSSTDTEAMNQINQTIQRVENAIVAEDGVDPVTGKHWTELIDTQSWVRKYLVEEVFGSGDACYISQYFYTDGALDGIVYAGPVWDFDHSIASLAGWLLTYPNSLYANRLHVKDGFDSPWFYSLYHNETFYQQMTTVYEEVFMPALNDLVSERIPAYGQRVAQASYLNRIRWSQPEVSMEAETAYLCEFLEKRMDFLSDLWLLGKQYCTIKVDQGFGAFYGYILVEPGEALDDLPILANTPTSNFNGWFYKDTGLPFDMTRPITSDIEIYAKWENSASNKLDDYFKLLPLGIIGTFGLILLYVECKRRGKGR